MPVSPLTGSSPTVARIDLAALAHNLAQVRRLASPGCEVLAVVKADAYGHGAGPVARALADHGVTRFGVTTVQEGAALREAGINGSILVLGAVVAEQAPALLAASLTPVIYHPALAERVADYIGPRFFPYAVHVKVDTGMGRLGLTPGEVLPLLTSKAFAGPLVVEGLMTHLADADNADASYTKEQIERFEAVLGAIKAAGLSVPIRHAANSAALIRHPWTHFDLVRPGLMLYGYSTLPPDRADLVLKPVLSLTSTVVQVRSLAPGESVSYNRTFVAKRASRVAVLPLGYADGLSRALSGKGRVLLHGRFAPIIGRICMDMTLVDVTDLPPVQPGDEAVLIGVQGDHCITAADVAEWAGTIPYEVLCTIGQRIPRGYV